MRKSNPIMDANSAWARDLARYGRPIPPGLTSAAVWRSWVRGLNDFAAVKWNRRQRRHFGAAFVPSNQAKFSKMILRGHYSA